jgi:hypothetical protein
LIYLNAEYSVSDALAVGLEIKDLQIASAYYFADSAGKAYDETGLGLLFPITFAPYANYAFTDTFSAGLALHLGINNNGSDQFKFGLTPSASFKLGENASFNVYDELMLIAEAANYSKSGDSDWESKHPGAVSGRWKNYDAVSSKDSGKAGSYNILQFDFVWSF